MAIVIVVPICGSILIAILLYAVWAKFCTKKQSNGAHFSKAKVHTDVSVVTLVT